MATAAVRELPPSAKLVHLVLRREGPMTQRALAAESRLCPRTVRHATALLEDAALVTVETHDRDRRQSIYTATAGGV